MARQSNSYEQFHVNETARAARAAHATLIRAAHAGDFAVLHVYYKPMRIEAFAEDNVPDGEGWTLAWAQAVPTDRTADQLVQWFAARTARVPYLTEVE